MSRPQRPEFDWSVWLESWGFFLLGLGGCGYAMFGLFGGEIWAQQEGSHTLLHGEDARFYGWLILVVGVALLVAGAKNLWEQRM